MFKPIRILTFLVVYGLTLVTVSAGNNTAPSTELSPFLQIVVDELGALEEKVTSLAEAVPDDKYGWRPEEGVRSVSEVFVHIGGANHFILSFLGKSMPEGFSQDAEKTMTNKADVIEFVKASFADAKEFVATLDDAGLEEVVKLPFAEMSKRKVLFLLSGHCHEHLGQVIAYARSNGITPPWSKDEN